MSQACKDKLWNGEFVHLNKLLLQEPSTEIQNQNCFGKVVLFKLIQKNKETKISNFFQWMGAFFIHASIYLEKHLLQAISLLGYKSTIVKVAASIHSVGFDYNVQFRMSVNLSSRRSIDT